MYRFRFLESVEVQKYMLKQIHAGFKAENSELGKVTKKDIEIMEMKGPIDDFQQK